MVGDCAASRHLDAIGARADNAARVVDCSFAIFRPDTIVTGQGTVRTLGDGAEVWDAWCNYAQLVPHATEETPALEPTTLSSLSAVASDDEKLVLAQYAAANERLSSRLLDLKREGLLQCGLRAVLPFIAMLHLHRFGMQPEQHAALARAMTESWDPRRGLRGATAERPSGVE